MLQIINIGTDASGSLVLHNNEYVGTIKRFPKKLSLRVIGVLDRLREGNVYGLKYHKQQGVVLSKDGDGYLCDLSVVPSILDKDSVMQTNEAIKLLHWYLEPNIHYPHPGSIYGAEPICCDCGYSQPIYDIGNIGKCSSPECPSHKKWAEVLCGYIPRTDKFKKAFLVIPRVSTLGRLPTRA